jgi:ABC-type Co2+ transport system permease subunit
MADKTSDVEDRLLESLFRIDPISDDGFSARVVSRIRRRIWFRRLAVPMAAIVGGAIAIRPAAELIGILFQVFNFVPSEIVAVPLSFLPQFQLIVLGGMLLAVVLTMMRFIEET